MGDCDLEDFEEFILRFERAQRTLGVQHIRRLIWLTLSRNGEMTERRIAAHIGHPRETVRRNVLKLIKSGVVERRGQGVALTSAGASVGRQVFLETLKIVAGSRSGYSDDVAHSPLLALNRDSIMAATSVRFAGKMPFKIKC